MSNSLVYLIGAGPGDPGLLTIKGRECIETADVVIYDYLANSRLLSYAREDAELIFVGKKGFSEHVTQGEINDLIVEKALADDGCVIARLKGGDPFVFGRGGEEALALVENSIPFEVVPGVTSGVAAPAYAGIPVTHRGATSSLAFITGHEDPNKNETSIDWAYLAQGVGTLCFYMGIRNLPLITSRLVENGRSAETPVALVRWGSTPKQEVLVGTLADIAEKAAAANFQAPAIIVVGDVVSLREKLAWFENKPLFGKTIVVTRSRAQASNLVEDLLDDGADVCEFPTIKVVPTDERAPLNDAIATLSSYDWIVFTSVNGVEYFFDRLLENGFDARALAGVKVAAIGPATAASVCEMGVVPDLIPDEYRAECVVEGLFDFGVGEGSRVLIPRAKEAREILPETLREKGVIVDVVPVYETVLADGNRSDIVARLAEGEIDAVTFTSSSTVKNFLHLLSELLPAGTTPEKALEGVALISIGPITSKTISEAGLTVAAEASDYTIPGLVETVHGFFA